MNANNEGRWTLVLPVLILAMMAPAIGCGDDGDNDDDDDSGSAGQGRDASVGGTGGTGRSGTGGGGTGGRSGSGGRSGAGGTSGAGGSDVTDDGGLADLELTDAEVAAVLRAANTGEVEQGELAMMQADDADVVAYATRMVEEHGAANTRLDTLLEDEDITPMANALSKQLASESMQTLGELEDETGMEFDLAYMRAQRAAHAEVLEIADMVLLPSTDNAELRAELEMMRPAVVEHLAEAEALLEQLE
jgi:putative membrane protein